MRLGVGVVAMAPYRAHTPRPPTATCLKGPDYNMNGDKRVREKKKQKRKERERKISSKLEE